ncbi:MAG: hypothetical protein ACQESA_03695 [Patescibacteria group bacterium]
MKNKCYNKVMQSSKSIFPIACFFCLAFILSTGTPFPLEAQNYPDFDRSYSANEEENPQEDEETSDFNLEERAEEIRNSDLYKQLMEYHGFTEDDFTGSFEMNIRGGEMPSAGEKVEFWTRTSLNKERSMFTWYVNGEVKQEGYGLDTFETEIEETGEEMIVEVYMKDDSGIEKSDTIIFTAGEVDIIWQTDTYTPAFYKGKPLSSRADRSEMDIIAIPNFTKNKQIEDPNQYIFTWKVDGSDYRSARGLNSITLDLSEISRRSGIEVRVQPLNRELEVVKSMSFPKSGNPNVLMYAEDFYGMDYSRAINYMESYPLNDDKVSVKAEPLFFTKKNAEEVEIEWSMNNEPLPDFAGNDKAGFSIEREFTGESSISVSIENRNNLREKINSEVIFDVDMANNNF